MSHTGNPPRFRPHAQPTSALDIGHAQDVLELIDAMRTTRNLTVERVEKIYNAKVKTCGHIIVPRR
ncbi:DNA-binding protein [Corynebacterium diphtheriae]|nr:DNA-binding protein [Corynebacterium diphtheriae bv. mitis]MBG9228568.1 DNA-binding protein [Corynebacterium diphtheriae bv. gravis]MBG9279767.1 DNA-binding protein [Corynebacterium diphtheriae]MBG9251323.1 DNA-binding protein [Corynebacterium diphtheriae bv. mitis]MBG9255543.1 DNA-binding protein [Corynebacterium diphtheriae bv. mitis]